jgi:hypothetical protein
MDGIERWSSYVDSLPWQPGQLNRSSFLAFLRAGSLSVDRQTACETVATRIIDSGGRLRARKIENQAAIAYQYAATSAQTGPLTFRKHFPRANPWPDPDPDLIARITESGPCLADLAESSPIRFDDGQPHTEEIIDALFPGNPLLCVGSSTRFKTAGRESFRGRLADLQLIVPSPMTALLGHTLEGNLSAHSLENTGPRRFIVVEFDHGPQDQQAALIDHLARRGPLALVVYSGGRSLHAWFPCSGVTEDVQLRFMKCARRLDADLSGWQNRSQFVRMPDGARPDGTRQPVHYFNQEVL